MRISRSPYVTAYNALNDYAQFASKGILPIISLFSSVCQLTFYYLTYCIYVQCMSLILSLQCI
jgi:hypothetical protein